MDINGKKIALEIRQSIKEQVAQIIERKPCLAVILVGRSPASEIYVGRKIKACEETGIQSKFLQFPDTISQTELIQEIHRLNDADEVDGILVQLPLPPNIDPEIIAQTVDPNKDVDGFHPVNLGRLLLGRVDGFIPCTPLGILTLLHKSHIETSGKHVVILGRSNIVGKPMAALLVQNQSAGNATVTIAHSHTKNLQEVTKLADILIVAIGKPQFVKQSMVKEGAVLIDVGINRMPNNQVVGDADYQSLKDHCSLITPVPGGVGPMTIAILLQNTLKSYKQTHSRIGNLAKKYSGPISGEDNEQAAQAG